MRKLIYIICGLAFFFVAGLIAIVLYLVTTQETDKNRKKTEAARQARWANRPLIPDTASQADIDRALDELNQNKKNDEDKAQDVV